MRQASRLTCAAWLVPAIALMPRPSRGFDHASYDKLLKTYVSKGRVDYAAIKANASKDLDAYLAAVAAANPGAIKGDDQLAFYLNAYNALVIREIVAAFPVAGPMKIAGFFDKKKHKVGGQTLTLNDLENKVIRVKYKEPRIHFALVCAARSCPPLQASAFAGKTLRANLERLTRTFLNGRLGVRIEGDKVQVSSLFDWYAPDFVAAAGSVGAFVARYRAKDAELLKKAKITFLSYDWSLNGK